MAQDYERQLGDMTESKETALADLTEFYQGKLEEMESTLQQVIQQTSKCTPLILSLIDARSTSRKAERE